MELLTPPPSAGRASAKGFVLATPRLHTQAAGPSPPSTPTDTASTPSTPGTRSSSPTTPSTPCTPDILVFSDDFVLQPAFAVGAWSEVHRAVNKADLLDAGKAGGRVYAVKTPSHTLARAVLRREARVLTHIHASARAVDFTVPFHGFHAATNGLVLDLGGPSLATEIAGRVAALRRPTTSSPATKVPATEPILGTATWLRTAVQLLRGLAWLHGAGVIHGDIKPANILLSPGRTPKRATDVVPVYCDFSSARLAADPPSPLPSDAVTAAYASPELLASLVSPSQGVPTAESDAWALAATLLVAATGEEPYAGARSTLQRLAMARSGALLEMARGGDEARRVKKGGMVSTCLEGALKRKGPERWTLHEWLAVLNHKVQAEGVTM